MNNLNDTMIRRSILLGARIRFSPSGSSIRNQAITRIIEQNLASNEATNGLTEQQLQNLVTLGGQLSVLRASDVRHGIDSLKKSGRVSEVPDSKEIRFILSNNAKLEVGQLISETEKQTRAVIKELFGKAHGGSEVYERAFLQLLCKVFAELSEVYVQVITRKQGNANYSEDKMLSAALEVTLQSKSIPDKEAFRYGVSRFFRESSPEFDKIKWNMAQNFYVAKALGIDSSFDLLSSDIFRDTVLYCDTNVLIAGLTPENRHHGSFKELAKACNALGMSLKAIHPTIEELRGTIEYHGDLLRKVIDKIPDAMLSKVRCFLLKEFLIERKTFPDLSLDIFLNRFQMPLQTLNSSFGLTEVDDEWFIKILDDSNTKKLAKDLSQKYFEMRGRKKWDGASIHDAILLNWTAHEKDEGQKVWAVTLDLTLTEWNSSRGANSYNVVTLDALLQWMTPVTSGSVNEDKMASIFSDAIKYHLLPRDTFFQLRDFQVFAEMGIETKQLPADDVEACIKEIKQAGPHLDPSKAEDREKIGQVIQRYFADPGTKYKRTIDDLQIQSENLSRELGEEKRRHADAEKYVKELETSSQEMSNKINENRIAYSEAQSRIEKLESLMQEQEKAEKHKKLVRSVVWRTLLALGILSVIEVIIGYLVWRFGEGPNLFQKLTKAWPWLGFGFACVAVVYRYILMGRERMLLLKWQKGDLNKKELDSE
ncbi:MAG TPA: hypothetical protein HA232_04305 [Methanocellales archaeon]|nr:hypothetical protein [Methanocellales archaeon]